MGNYGKNSEPRFGDADSKDKDVVDECAGHVPSMPPVHFDRSLLH
jgi:hypothetical protein